MNILTLLKQQNPWWVEPGYRPAEMHLAKRLAFAKLYSQLTDLRLMQAIVGLRRIGKSTLVKQMIGELLISGISPQRILYFSFDDPTVEANADVLTEIIETYLNQILKQPWTSLTQKHYLFFDEIQLVPLWQGLLKRYYDLTPNFKFIVTGSSSLYIYRKAKESLAGRIQIHTLPTLSWQEHKLWFPQDQFDYYLKWGGFPELRSLVDIQSRQNYLKDAVINKVMEIDIPKITHIRHRADFARLFWSLQPNTSQVIDLPRLGTDLQIKKSTLFDYLDLLVSSLLEFQVLNTAGSFRSSKRLLRKYYPASPSFLSLSNHNLDDGAWAESLVAQILHDRFSGDLGLFRQRDTEVDFVVPEQKIAIEVKYQPSIRVSDCESVKQYSQKNNYQPLVLTNNFSGMVNGVSCLPLEEWTKGW